MRIPYLNIHSRIARKIRRLDAKIETINKGIHRRTDKVRVKKASKEKIESSLKLKGEVKPVDRRKDLGKEIKLKSGPEEIVLLRKKFNKEYWQIIALMKEKDITQKELDEKTRVYLRQIEKWLGTGNI